MKMKMKMKAAMEAARTIASLSQFKMETFEYFLLIRKINQPRGLSVARWTVDGLHDARRHARRSSSVAARGPGSRDNPEPRVITDNGDRQGFALHPPLFRCLGFFSRVRRAPSSLGGATRRRLVSSFIKIVK